MSFSPKFLAPAVLMLCMMLPNLSYAKSEHRLQQ